MKPLKILALTALLATHVFAFEKVYATFDVEAEQAATLALSVSGIVGEIKADVGDSVKANDPLLVLENSEEHAALKRAEADYRSAKIAMEHATRQT
jgi:multidrug resistance efflux pump